MSKTSFSKQLTNFFALKVPLALFIAVCALLVVAWRPWDAPVKASDRTINVTGEAKITAVPDEYVFYPQYHFVNTDAAAALKEATAKNNEVTAKLIELGVPKKKIRVDTSGFGGHSYPEKLPQDEETTYYDSITITVDNEELAQKVQDYLLTTSPTGSVSPQANFSDTMRKKLENRGRDQATRDARAKAEQSAQNLGFKVGKVKSVVDNASDGLARPFDAGVTTSVMPEMGRGSVVQGMAILPGESSLTYQVSVTYYVR